MDQEIRNQEEKAMSPSLTKQHQREKRLDVLTQKDQKEVSEVVEGVEIRGEPQAGAKKIKEGHTGNTKTLMPFLKRSVATEHTDILIQR